MGMRHERWRQGAPPADRRGSRRNGQRCRLTFVSISATLRAVAGCDSSARASGVCESAAAIAPVETAMNSRRSNFMSLG